MAYQNMVRVLIVGIMVATGVADVTDVESADAKVAADGKVDGQDAKVDFVADAPEGEEGPPAGVDLLMRFLSGADGAADDANVTESGLCFAEVDCATNCLNGTKCVKCLGEANAPDLWECASLHTESGEEQAPLKPQMTCRTVTPMETDPLAKYCYGNVTWAIETGLTAEPKFYTDYTLTSNSSFDDFQCALHKMAGAKKDGKGWSCPLPCGSSMLAKGTSTPECPVPERELPPTTVVTTTTTASSGSSSFPWWAWVLLGVSLLGVIGALAYFFMGKDAKPKKKKRATKTVAKKAEPAPVKAPETPAPPAIPVITAPPVYVTSPQYAPVQTYASPIATYAAAPAVPIQTMATPVQYAAAPATMSYAAAPAPMPFTGAPVQYAAPPAYSATMPAYGSAMVPTTLS